MTFNPTAMTTFDSVDMIATINDQPISELEKVSYEESLRIMRDADGKTIPPISGKIIVHTNDEVSSIRRALTGVKDRLMLFLNNDDGTQSTIQFVGFEATKRARMHDQGSSVFKDVYYFTADGVQSNKTPWEWSKGKSGISARPVTTQRLATAR